MNEEGEILSVIAAPLYLLLERIGDGIGVRPQFPPVPCPGSSSLLIKSLDLDMGARRLRFWSLLPDLEPFPQLPRHYL